MVTHQCSRTIDLRVFMGRKYTDDQWENLDLAQVLRSSMQTNLRGLEVISLVVTAVHVRTPACRGYDLDLSSLHRNPVQRDQRAG